VFDTFNVIFYEGSNNLIANNTFLSQGQDLLIFSGGTYFGPLNVGGTGYTVWGNTFSQAAQPTCPLYPSCEVLINPAFGLGLQLAGSFNLVYNNEFLTATTAWLLPINLYTGTPEFFTDSFNITPVPASVVNYAPSFPTYPLTGVILGPGSYVNGVRAEQDWQGGNYWWDYGSTNPVNGAFNAFGILPYDENAPTLLVEIYGPAYYYATYIHPGGDYAPIVPFTLWTVTFHTVGLPSGATWNASIWNFGVLYENFSTTSTTFSVQLPNAFLYSLFTGGPTGYVSTPNCQYCLNINTHNAVIVVTFSPVSYSVTFTETGLPAKTLAKVGWTLFFDGAMMNVRSAYATINGVVPGTYSYLIAGPAGYRVSGVAPSGTIVVSSANVPVTFSFAKGATYALTFSEKGLTKGTNWCVVVAGGKTCTTKTALKTLDLTPGTYAYSILTVSGYTATATIGKTSVPLTGSVTLSKSTTVSVKFTA